MVGIGVVESVKLGTSSWFMFSGEKRRKEVRLKRGQ